jgi:hypothetical protein
LGVGWVTVVGPEPPAYWGDGREARQNRLTADGEVRT